MRQSLGRSADDFLCSVVLQDIIIEVVSDRFPVVTQQRFEVGESPLVGRIEANEFFSPGEFAVVKSDSIDEVVDVERAIESAVSERLLRLHWLGVDRGRIIEISVTVLGE